jgi:hypothetical protein
MGHERPIREGRAMSASPPEATGLLHHGERRWDQTCLSMRDILGSVATGMIPLGGVKWLATSEGGS